MWLADYRAQEGRSAWGPGVRIIPMPMTTRATSAQAATWASVNYMQDGNLPALIAKGDTVADCPARGASTIRFSSSS